MSYNFMGLLTTFQSIQHNISKYPANNNSRTEAQTTSTRNSFVGICAHPYQFPITETRLPNKEETNKINTHNDLFDRPYFIQSAAGLPLKSLSN